MSTSSRSFGSCASLIVSLALVICGANLAAAQSPSDLSQLLGNLEAAVRQQDREAMMIAAHELADRGDPRAIPDLIGIMDADNSDDTIYVIGDMALAPLTGEPDTGRWPAPSA